MCFSLDISYSLEYASDIIFHFIVHFSLSGPFIGYLYSWHFPVSVQMITFVFPGCIVTSPLVLFVFALSSPVLCTVYAGEYVEGCLGSVVVATWLDMILWIFSHLALVLYMCTSGALQVLP